MRRTCYNPAPRHLSAQNAASLLLLGSGRLSVASTDASYADDVFSVSSFLGEAPEQSDFRISSPLYWAPPTCSAAELRNFYDFLNVARCAETDKFCEFVEELQIFRELNLSDEQSQSFEIELELDGKKALFCINEGRAHIELTAETAIYVSRLLAKNFRGVREYVRQVGFEKLIESALEQFKRVAIGKLLDSNLDASDYDVEDAVDRMIPLIKSTWIKEYRRRVDCDASFHKLQDLSNWRLLSGVFSVMLETSFPKIQRFPYSTFWPALETGIAKAERCDPILSAWVLLKKSLYRWDPETNLAAAEENRIKAVLHNLEH